MEIPQKMLKTRHMGVSEKWRIPKTIGFKTNMIWGYTHDIETSMFEPTKRKRKTQRKTKPPMPPFPSVSPSQWLQAVPAKQLLLNGFCLLPLTFQFEDSTCNIRRWYTTTEILHRIPVFQLFQDTTQLRCLNPAARDIQRFPKMWVPLHHPF